MGRVLGYSVPVHDVPGSPTGVTYPAGTPEEEIPEEHLAQITNPKAWTDPFGDGPDLGVIEPEPEQEFPEHLEDCSVAQLKKIAERGDAEGYPIELGNLKSKADIIAVLREAGIDNEGGGGPE